MRERQVYEMHAQTARRESLLLRQFEFLQIRQEAFERVWLAAGLRERVTWFFKPDVLIATVDAVQRVLLDKRMQEVRAEAAKPKIQVVRP